MRKRKKGCEKNCRVAPRRMQKQNRRMLGLRDAWQQETHTRAHYCRRARRRGIYIGFSPCDSDLLGISPCCAAHYPILSFFFVFIYFYLFFLFLFVCRGGCCRAHRAATAKVIKAVFVVRVWHIIGQPRQDTKRYNKIQNYTPKSLQHTTKSQRASSHYLPPLPHFHRAVLSAIQKVAHLIFIHFSVL